MKIFKTALILAGFGAIASGAFAQSSPKETHFVFGDGTTAFILSTDQSTFFRQGMTAQSVSVSKQLGARGDVVYKDADEHVLVRLSISGAATYYPHEDSKGLPVSLIDVMAPIPDLESVEEWSAAYQYKGAKTMRPEERPAPARQDPSN